MFCNKSTWGESKGWGCQTKGKAGRTNLTVAQGKARLIADSTNATKRARIKVSRNRNRVKNAGNQVDYAKT